MFLCCMGECPQGALKIVEREADEFDEEAVEEMLKQQEMDKKEAAQILSKMGNRQAAKVMGALSPGLAAEITRVLKEGVDE